MIPNLFFCSSERSKWPVVAHVSDQLCFMNGNKGTRAFAYGRQEHVINGNVNQQWIDGGSYADCGSFDLILYKRWNIVGQIPVARLAPSTLSITLFPYRATLPIMQIKTHIDMFGRIMVLSTWLPIATLASHSQQYLHHFHFFHLFPLTNPYSFHLLPTVQ